MSTVRLRGLSHLLRYLARRVAAVEPELASLPALIRPGATCLDVGAKHGAYTLVMAGAVGENGHVVAFEPLPNPRRLMRVVRRLLGARHVTIVAAAVADRSGSGRMGLPVRRGIPVPGRAFLSSHAAGLGSNAGWRHRSVAIDLVTLDAVAAEMTANPVHLIKVDVEGAEQLVLHGASALLERDRPTLLLELEDRHLHRFGAAAADIFANLHARGYHAHVLVDHRWARVGQVSDTQRNHLFWHPLGPHPQPQTA